MKSIFKILTLALLVTSNAFGVTVIKESRTNEDIKFIVRPAGVFTEAVVINGTTGGFVLTSAVQLPDGTVSAPALSFNSDNDGTGTGIYRIGANNLGFAANGAIVGQYQATGVWVIGPPSGGNFSHVIQSASTTDIAPLRVENTTGSSAYVKFTTGGTARGWIGTTSTKPLSVLNNAGSERFAITQSTGTATKATLTAESTSLNNAIEFNDSSATRFYVNHINNATVGSQYIALGSSANGDALAINNSAFVGIGVVGTSIGRQLHVKSAGTAYEKLETSTNNQYAGTEYTNPAKTYTVGVEGPSNDFVITNSAGFGATSNYIMDVNSSNISKFQYGINVSPAGTGNTLNNYSEGTCTPAFTPGSGTYGTLTYTAQICSWTRVGRMVTITVKLALSAFNTGTAGAGTQVNIALTGAPAPATSGTGFFLQMGFIENITYPANSTQGGQAYCAILIGNGTKCFPYAMRNSATGNTQAFDQSTSLSNTARMEFSGTYFTD